MNKRIPSAQRHGVRGDENYFAKKKSAGPPPARLQRIADQAAQSGDLRSKHPADCASCANAPWDELRVWDPGD